MTIHCPTCKRTLEGEAEALPFRPFCSERCRLVDLGSWLDGGYRIGAPAGEEDELDTGLPGGSSHAPDDDESAN